MNSPHPAAPQPSASVILLDPIRGGEEAFGLFLLRRQSGSKFMPNRFVFPGGRLETLDGSAQEGEKAWRICALRELWEEAGVILARSPEQAAGLEASARERARQELQAGHKGLEEVLAGLGLEPDLQGLTPYARWITPLARSQRFDTIFYLALMPADQEACCDQLETSQGLWLGPARALTENLQGQVELAPPQVRILGELSQYGDVNALLARARESRLAPVEPCLWSDGRSRVVLLPQDPDYSLQAPRRPEDLGRPCPAQTATRLVHQAGRWLPYCQD